MTTETTTSSLEIYNDDCNTAIIVVFVLFSSFSIMINLFTVISIARHCAISVCTLLACCLSAVELLNAFACGATTLYSYLKTSDSFESSSVLCNFCAWVNVAFRIMATLIVTFLVFDRLLLSLRPMLYVKQWSSFRTRWVVPLSVFVVGALLASLPFANSSYSISPDGGRFHCLFDYTGSFAIFYIVFHFVQSFGGFAIIPWVVSREDGVDARLSVLVVGEMVVCRKGDDIVKIRESLKISRLVGAVVVLYHGCSAFFPIILLLRLLHVDYPAVVGLIALQLPTYGAMFLPIVYGFTWKPYRRAYYASFSCLFPPLSKQMKTRRIRSIYNPAFRETREYDANSILHTRGVSLHQSTSQFDMSSTVPSSSAPSDPIELDPSQLTTHAEPTSFRRRPDLLPRAKSFQEQYRYTPTKFQSIFEIIDALSDPRRNANDETSDLSDTEESRIDSLGSSGPSSPVHLNEVSLKVDATDVFSGVNFSAINVSSWPNSTKVINKSRLRAERPDSFKGFHFKESYKEQNRNDTQTDGPIRFTDLKKTRPDPKAQSAVDERQVNGENRFLRYLANESYVSNKE
ncbi:uncharacterized protein LOC114518355 [Dendronephthya gigantea]|uniref:uncharacterized protein LOC114518355 n=1 Tax=Dendronephthya gigantea TaxID=151771 RepID=UPI00106C5FCB|nr:uncharacterized protein LOC114518355 [Dendronephthya gigantea]